MQYQRDSKPHARLNTFHGTKKQLLGHHVQPAWKPNAVSAPSKQLEASGSKILLSRLPTDVGEKEVDVCARSFSVFTQLTECAELPSPCLVASAVQELFRKTVGPVKDCFMIYNSQSKSKGMAIVTFSKASDASSAKAKYHGKIVDGRRPLKIEFITDDIPSAASQPQPKPLTLLERLGEPVSNAPVASTSAMPAAKPASKKNPSGKPAPVAPVPATQAVRRQRMKKGPKRLKKREPVTAAQLDQDMDTYRTGVPSMDNL
ncbi:hypothetical protein EST38_g3756 [Candolleomyces aberdarensis]|uniref:RRM domain-containing protein n=1 Tax=Candolleomyces aberdarensis TaxID=2316362 RepID=A0A4Q2DRH3_9AGAR|nr:hypothetical protein EST38_g3756 [Candolleomyces aberdarensis]